MCALPCSKSFSMIPILSKTQIYQADLFTCENEQITSLELMERAGKSAFLWLDKWLNGATTPIHIFSGIGNNGGDGLVIGRYLLEKGYNVTCYIVNYSDKRSPNFLQNYDAYKNTTNEWPVLLSESNEFPQIEPQALILDCIFGIGLNRAPVHWVKQIILQISNHNAFTVSIDLPSGMSPDHSSYDLTSIINAQHTLTFEFPKLPFLLPETGIFAPSFSVLPIGLNTSFLKENDPIGFVLTIDYIKSLLRPRNKFSHKGNYGHAVFIGGSYGKIGAVALAGQAALHTGSGLVTVFVPKCGISPIQAQIPELMVLTDTNNNSISNVSIPFKPTVLGIGMGMGTEQETQNAFLEILELNLAPMVIDADAINCIALSPDLLNKLPQRSILTPHPGELKRLIGPWNTDYDKIEKVKLFSKKYNVIVIVKGAHTMIVDNDKLYFNNTGNPGMATAGSGDVLSGIITSLVGQGYNSLQASCIGVYLHGMAGDIVAETEGEQAVTASKISKAIGKGYLSFLKP